MRDTSVTIEVDRSARVRFRDDGRELIDRVRSSKFLNKVKLTPTTEVNESPVIAEIVNSMPFGGPNSLSFDPEIGPASDPPFRPFDFFRTHTTDPTLTAIDNDEDRHDVSLNTCCGWHGGAAPPGPPEPHRQGAASVAPCRCLPNSFTKNPYRRPR